MRRRRRRERTPEQERRHSHRFQRFFRGVMRILFLGLLLAAAVAALTVFFKVSTISVEGASKYSAEEIVSALDVKQGDNLYLWNKPKTISNLQRRLPYLETVQIRRHLPNTLVVSVVECRAAVAVQTNGVYFVVSEKGKVLEQTADAGTLPVVLGVTLDNAVPGELLDPAGDTYIDALLTVLQTLDAANMLDDLDFVNLTELTDVRIGYLDRFDIRVGTVEQLAYRLRFAQTVISERLSPSDIGMLYWDNKNRLHFVPDTAENVAKSGGVTTAADTTPAHGTDAAQTGGADAFAGGQDPSADSSDSTDGGTDASDSGGDEEQ